jgi:enamine deaminase RidA (YjgF/YER057c/UK114 family)
MDTVDHRPHVQKPSAIVVKAAQAPGVSGALLAVRMITMKKVFNPPSVRRPFGQYNHGLLVPAGASLLVTSGQLGIGLDDVVPADVTAQAELCFEAIKAILNEADMSFADVIRVSGFVTRREDFAAYMAVRDRYTLDTKPVSTLIIVGGFTRPDFLVEVEVTAAKVF